MPAEIYCGSNAQRDQVATSATPYGYSTIPFISQEVWDPSRTLPLPLLRSAASLLRRRPVPLMRCFSHNSISMETSYREWPLPAEDITIHRSRPTITVTCTWEVTIIIQTNNPCPSAPIP